MKKLYLLTLIVLLQTTGYAQPYLSIFGDSSTAWNVTRSVPDAQITDSLYTGGDSLFNGHKYISVLDHGSVVGLIREDTALGKVWYYSTEKKEEHLIMDLNLSIGDSFYLNVASWERDSIAIVDTVYYDALGKKHIVLDFMNHFQKREPFKFIEGLGTNAGIMYQCRNGYYGQGNFTGNMVLLCSFKDGTSYYSSPLLVGTQYEGQCYIFSTGIEEKNQTPSWKLYPNPFYDYSVLSFENEQALNCTLEIYNLQGQIVQSKQNITTEEIRIEKDKLKNGTYFFRLYGDAKVIAAGKMIVGL